MEKEARNKQVVEELALGFDLDPDDDEKVLNMPEIVKQLNQYANSPKIVIAFLYDAGSGRVVLTTPNIPPDPQAFMAVSQGCMEAAKQFSNIAQELSQQEKEDES